MQIDIRSPFISYHKPNLYAMDHPFDEFMQCSFRPLFTGIKTGWPFWSVPYNGCYKPVREQSHKKNMRTIAPITSGRGRHGDINFFQKFNLSENLTTKYR
jgi:hypothetical protein